jgi:hypothetical protein
MAGKWIECPQCGQIVDVPTFAPAPPPLASPIPAPTQVGTSTPIATPISSNAPASQRPNQGVPSWLELARYLMLVVVAMALLAIAWVILISLIGDERDAYDFGRFGGPVIGGIVMFFGCLFYPMVGVCLPIILSRTRVLLIADCLSLAMSCGFLAGLLYCCMLPLRPSTIMFAFLLLTCFNLLAAMLGCLIAAAVCPRARP